LTGALRVLVADDNAVNRALMAAFLDSLDCESVEVESGIAAIDVVRSGAVDLVLMDLQMPEIDGIEATRQIRALPAPANATPVLAVTAYDSPETARRCREAGMNDFIGKPLTRQKLIAALKPWRPDVPPSAAESKP